MDGIDVTLRLIGAFYAFAGFLVARAALMSNLLDEAIAAITLKKTNPIEKHRTIWLLSLSTLIFASGACLMFLLRPAAWLFAAATIIQAMFFLGLGPYYFDLADPPDPKGRRQSYNAFVIYTACTFFVIWAAYTGRLVTIAAAPPLLIGSAAAAIMLHIGYILRHTFYPPKRSGGFGSFDGGTELTSDNLDDASTDSAGLPIESKRIKLMADYYTYPLWQMDEGLVGDFAPNRLGVSLELENDLWKWAGDFDVSLNDDDPANSLWTEEQRKAHVEEGVKLACRIKRELPEREVFVHDTEGDLIEITPEQAAP